jgi:hypothetical protein
MVKVIQFSSLPKNWSVEEVSRTEIHIHPVSDWRIHTLTDHCLCGPVVKYRYLGRRVIHNSFDGRETDEHPTLGYVN